MVNLLTWAASFKSWWLPKSLTKLGSPNLAAEISLVLLLQLSQLPYYISSLSSKHFMEIFDAVCDFQNLEKK